MGRGERLTEYINSNIAKRHDLDILTYIKPPTRLELIIVNRPVPLNRLASHKHDRNDGEKGHDGQDKGKVNDPSQARLCARKDAPEKGDVCPFEEPEVDAVEEFYVKEFLIRQYPHSKNQKQRPTFRNSSFRMNSPNPTLSISFSPLTCLCKILAINPLVARNSGRASP